MQKLLAEPTLPEGLGADYTSYYGQIFRESDLDAGGTLTNEHDSNLPSKHLKPNTQFENESKTRQSKSTSETRKKTKSKPEPHDKGLKTSGKSRKQPPDPKLAHEFVIGDVASDTRKTLVNEQATPEPDAVPFISDKYSIKYTPVDKGPFIARQLTTVGTTPKTWRIRLEEQEYVALSKKSMLEAHKAPKEATPALEPQAFKVNLAFELLDSQLEEWKAGYKKLKEKNKERKQKDGKEKTHSLWLDMYGSSDEYVRAGFEVTRAQEEQGMTPCILDPAEHHMTVCLMRGTTAYVPRTAYDTVRLRLPSWADALRGVSIGVAWGLFMVVVRGDPPLSDIPNVIGFGPGRPTVW